MMGHRRGVIASSRAGTPPPFVPTDLSNISLWLNAPTLGLSNGANVTSWTDNSGLNNHATGVSDIPTYATNVINGLSVVRFSGSNQFLTFTSTIGGVQRTFFIVAKNNDNTFGSVMIGQTASSSHYFYLNNYVRAVDGAGALIDSGTFSTGQFRVCEHWCNGTNSRTAYDGNYGTLSGATNSLQCTHVGAYNPGGGGGPFYMEGDIAEIIAYTRALNSTELSQVRAYLATKYALTVTP